MQFLYDVAIVGGGPAGMATALTLNSLGISNCVVEASATPKSKYGEALPPNAKPILNQLGLLSLVEDAHHIRYYGNKSCWGSDQVLQNHFISTIHGNGYLLDRPYFERQLWDYYEEQEGTLFKKSKLRNIARQENSLLLLVDHKDQKKDILCKYIVDATGRKASVCRMLGFNKIDLDDQFALSMDIKSRQTQEHQITVEATPEGWWYAAPNGQGNITLMFFTLKRLLPKKSDRTAFFKTNLMRSIHLSKFISPSILAKSDVNMMPAGTSRLEVPYGDNWIAVGDAAFSYDPISSYGITSALASGYYAGQALASSLSGKDQAMNAYRYIVENAFRAYEKKLINHYNQEKRWPERAYWKNRI